MGIYSEAFYKHWILFTTVWHLPRLSQGRTQGRPKCVKNVLKWRTFKLQAWITGKRLKIDWYMLRGVWHALNSLSIHVTLTAIVPGDTPYGSVKCKGGRKKSHVQLAIAILLVFHRYSACTNYYYCMLHKVIDYQTTKASMYGYVKAVCWLFD